jgi:hypothetical protein
MDRILWPFLTLTVALVLASIFESLTLRACGFVAGIGTCCRDFGDN